MATKTLLNLEVKEIDGDKFNMVIKAEGSRLKLNLYLLNGMLQNDDLAQIINDAAKTFNELKKEQRKRRKSN